MEMPQIRNDEYKFMVFTLLQHDFSVLSTQTIANIGAKIMIYKPLEFKHMKVGELNLNSFFLDKQFPIKQRGDNTCMIDFIWHQCQNKFGFKRYTYQKLKDELSEFATTTICKNDETLPRKNDLSCLKSLLVTGL